MGRLSTLEQSMQQRTAYYKVKRTQRTRLRPPAGNDEYRACDVRCSQAFAANGSPQTSGTNKSGSVWPPVNTDNNYSSWMGEGRVWQGGAG